MVSSAFKVELAVVPTATPNSLEVIASLAFLLKRSNEVDLLKEQTHRSLPL